MKAEKNRQHYVPKFYLRNFSGSEKAINAFNITNTKFILNASIRNMCQKNNFYGSDNRVEDFLGDDIEGRASAIIQEILKTKSIPQNVEDYMHLLMFIMVMEARNIKMSDSLDKMVDFIAKSLLESNLDFKDINPNDFTVSLNNGVVKSIKAAIEMTPVIADLEPVLIIKKSSISRSFIASDNPVIRYNPLYLNKNYPSGFGYATKGLMVFLPLSHEVCLLLYDKEIYNIPLSSNNRLVLNRAKDIDYINDLIYLNSYNNVFIHQSVKESYLLDIYYRNRKFPKIRELEREVAKFQSKQSENYLLHFSQNRVTRKLKFDWFNYTNHAEGLDMPKHMGGLLRMQSEFIRKIAVKEKEYYRGQ